MALRGFVQTGQRASPAELERLLDAP